ncbi:type VII toxin-antitoxin system MntA family adenylyltransferase antitoxin [Aquifex aeolicus]|uniref:type VII toxin-antitoxin system MntA family adenylyltransferase antitoxin n=1 Tax=Aquifex aeolicus TaxID=63363 RepID=UPI003CCCD34D
MSVRINFKLTMAKIETIEDLRKYIEDFFKRRNKKVKVILFGSRARGTHTSYSDVDIAILSDENIDNDLILLREEIENSLLPQKVDIVGFSKLEESFKEEILKEGKVWIDLTKS